MKVAIVGLPQSGRTTTWRALARKNAGRENTATIKLPDDKLMAIAHTVKARKITHVEVELIDTIGDISKGGSIISEMQGVDLLLLVIRAFDGGYGTPTLIDDARKLAEAFIINDSAIIETRMATLKKDIPRRSHEERRQLEEQLHTLEFFASKLESGELIRNIVGSLDENGVALTRNFGFLTGKRWLFVANTEDDVKNGGCEQLAQIYNCNAISFPAGIHAEFAELDEEEGASFAAEFGVEFAAPDKVLLAMKEALDIIEFYTGNEKEARGWAITRGTRAQDAAGKIHTDIGRGFIRAEIVSCDKFLEAGGYAEARAKAFFRVEGKDYIMQDGDYVSFRFNV